MDNTTENNKSSTPAFIIVTLVIDLLLMLYTAIMICIRFLTTKTYLDIFYDKVLDMVQPAFLIGIIANGIMVFITLCVLVAMYIDGGFKSNNQ